MHKTLTPPPLGFRTLLTAIALAVAGMAFSHPAKAQETYPRFYIGGGVGISTSDTDCPAGAQCDDDTSGYKVLAGSRFNDNFAIEVAYVISGEASVDDGTTYAEGDTTTFSLAPVVHFPIGEDVSILAKAGFHSWESDVERTRGNRTELFSFDGTDIFYGVGAQLKLSENLGVRIEWERYEAEISIGAVSVSDSSDTFGVGLIYSF